MNGKTFLFVFILSPSGCGIYYFFFRLHDFDICVVKVYLCVCTYAIHGENLFIQMERFILMMVMMMMMQFMIIIIIECGYFEYKVAKFCQISSHTRKVKEKKIFSIKVNELKIENKFRMNEWKKNWLM